MSKDAVAIRLSRSVVGTEEADAVARVLLEDGYLGMGQEVRCFEEELACWLGMDATQVVTVSSGTAALHLALECALPQGGEVLLPSLTYVAAFQAVCAAGCVPVPCEVDPRTCLLDLNDAAARLTSRTVAIMPALYAGNPYELSHVHAFAAHHGLRCIEDAAHAFGSQHQGRKVGSFGDITCFSFDGIKNMTSGEGGAIVSCDAQLLECCRDARLLGVRQDTSKRFAGQRTWDMQVERQGWRYHMSNIMAAIGRVQLSRFTTGFAHKRCQLAALYRQYLSQESALCLLYEDEGDSIVPHIFPVQVLNGRRDALRDALAQQGIETGIHYKPNHLLARFGHGIPQLPVTEELYASLLSLPLHPLLSEEDIKYICLQCRSVLARL